jgi:hypothetical protein
LQLLEPPQPELVYLDDTPGTQLELSLPVMRDL